MYASIIVMGFFGLVEGSLRLVGVSAAVQPRILLRRIDSDIGLPFMRPDADTFWSPKPGWQGEFLGKPVTINRMGLRGAEVAQPKPTSRTRIVCFGDSITFGYGVGDEETYPFLMGRALADSGVEVVNAGVTGYTSHQVRRLAARLLPQIQADVVLIMIGWNDGNRRPVDDREYDRRLHLLMTIEGPLDRLYTYRALKRAYLLAVSRRGLEPTPGERPMTPRVGLEQYRENLAVVTQEARARGARPVFVALPRRTRPSEILPDPTHARALLEIGPALGVMVLSSGELGLDTSLPQNDDFYLDLLHLNPAGNARLAELLVRQLVEAGLVGPGSDARPD